MACVRGRRRVFGWWKGEKAAAALTRALPFPFHPAFGLPHRRRRVFLLASLHGDARDVLLAPGRDGCPGSCVAVCGGPCFACVRPGDQGAPVSVAVDLGNAQSQPGLGIVPTLKTTNVSIALLTADKRIGRLPLTAVEALQGLPPGWTAPAWPPPGPGGGAPPARERPRGGRGGVAAAVAAAVAADVDAPPPPHDASTTPTPAAAAKYARWALCGNAVAVPVSRWLGEGLARPGGFKFVPGPRDAPLRVAGVPTGPPSPPPLTPTAALAVGEGGAYVGEWFSYVAATGRQAAGVCLGGARVAGGVVPCGGDAPPPPPPRAVPGAGGSGAPVPSPPALAGGRRSGRSRARSPSASRSPPPPPLPSLSVSAFQALASTRAGAAALRPPGRRPPPRPRPSGRGAPPGTSAAWPRAAWYVAGAARHASAASDAPVVSALTPLHEFVPGPLAPLPDGALLTYAARMREQGWDVSHVLALAAACGVALPTGVAPADIEHARLPGPRRPTAVGDVVWARTEGDEGAWWPAEALVSGRVGWR